MIEKLVVAAFIVSCLVLVFGSMVVVFGSITADNAEDTLFARHRKIQQVTGALLVPVAIGFPVITHGNPRAFPISFAFSAIALLFSLRIWLGPRAKWASYAAGLVIVAIIGLAIWHKSA